MFGCPIRVVASPYFQNTLELGYADARHDKRLFVTLIVAKPTRQEGGAREAIRSNYSTSDISLVFFALQDNKIVNIIRRQYSNGIATVIKQFAVLPLVRFKKLGIARSQVYIESRYGGVHSTIFDYDGNNLKTIFDNESGRYVSSLSLDSSGDYQVILYMPSNQAARQSGKSVYINGKYQGMIKVVRLKK